MYIYTRIYIKSVNLKNYSKKRKKSKEKTEVMPGVPKEMKTAYGDAEARRKSEEQRKISHPERLTPLPSHRVVP